MIRRSSAQRPVLDVLEVVLDALLERGVAAQAVDLRPAGDARLDHVAVHVVRDALPELLHELGALGRGPTIDMSPCSTFKSCGSSSRSSRAARPPDRVRLASMGFGPTRVSPGSSSASFVQRAELIDERNGPPSDPSAPAGTGPVRDDVHLIRRRDDGAGNRDQQHRGDAADSTMSSAALDHRHSEALQRHVVDVDDRQAVEFLEAARAARGTAGGRARP